MEEHGEVSVVLVTVVVDAVEWLLSLSLLLLLLVVQLSLHSVDLSSFLRTTTTMMMMMKVAQVLALAALVVALVEVLSY